MPPKKKAPPRRKGKKKRAVSRSSAEFHVGDDNTFTNANLLVDRIDHAKYDAKSLDPFFQQDDDDEDDSSSTSSTETYSPEISPDKSARDDFSSDDDDDDEDDIPEVIAEEQAADLDELTSAVEDIDAVKKHLRKANTLPSVPILYGMDRATCGQKKSSEDTTKCMFVWHCYMSEWEGRIAYIEPKDEHGRERPRTELFGLSLYRQEAFTAQTSDAKAYDTQFLGRTFSLLSNYCTYAMLKKAICFYNAHLKAEHKNRMLAAGHPVPVLSDPQIGCDESVKQQMSASGEKRSTHAMDNCEDLFSAVDNLITDDESRRIMDGTLNPRPDGKIVKMHPLNRLNMAASYTASRQDVRRGDEHYQQFRVQRFVRELKCLGPHGTHCSFVMTRQAKHNKTGRIELMAFGPHLDPILDASAWHGAQLLYRVFCLSEDLVHFKDDGTFDFEAQYKVPTYKNVGGGASKKKDQRISKFVYRSNWQNAFHDADVKVAKLTSQWRMQAFHEMDDAGLTDSQMA